MTASALALATTVSAAPYGLLQISSGGTGVRVSAAAIDWLPLGGGQGTIVTDAGTDVTYVGGSMTGGGHAGTILDLPPEPSPGFMTFAGFPLVFDLTALGPGSAVDCGGPGSFVTSGSCSFAGSPFILTVIDEDTTFVGLGASGLVTEGAGYSTWDGSFSTQVQLGIGEIYQAIYGGGIGYIQSSYSGEFDVLITPVPEPASMALLGLGLAAAAVGLRRRRQ